jgi:hypothetical protein
MRLGRDRVMSDAEAARWALIKEGGRRRYLVVTGVLRWALPVAFISTVIEQLIGVHGPFVGRLAIALVASTIFGIVFGAAMWSMGERRYQEWRVAGNRERR